MITFIGQPKGEHIYIDVLLEMHGGNEKITSRESRLMVTLEQWHQLLNLSASDDSERENRDPIFWATSAAGYRSSTGEAVPA